jgi:predicted nucleic acid-binding protein
VTAQFGLLVTDASPLITLAAADALDCLTRLGLPISIPDMVYMEVTQDMAKLGALGITDWVRANPDRVRILPTQVYAEFEAVRSLNPHARSRGRGEQAALELLNDYVAATPDAQAFLLFEDSDITNRSFVRALPERVVSISTGDLLCELEAAGLIQSADHILDEAAQAHRNIERQRQATGSVPLKDHLAKDER